MGNYHVVPRGDKWAVIGENKEAIRRGKELAQREGSELIIHGKDGKIRDKDSYGNDPFPPRDKKF